jgi:diguanylate cyclase (GGDEF)-like protein
MVADKLIEVIRTTSKESELIIKFSHLVAEYVGADKVNFLMAHYSQMELAREGGLLIPIEVTDGSVRSAWQIVGGPTTLSADQQSWLQVAGHLLVVALENSTLRQQVIVDPLTKLYNRMYFDIRLKEEAEKSKRYESPFSLLMIDIDHFRSFNDAYGHQAGDQVLRIVAQALRNNTRSSDLVFRYGGEEFAIYLPHLGREKATKVASRLKQHLDATIETADRLRLTIKEHHLDTAGRSVPISISIGISAFGGAHRDLNIEQIIKEADDSLYRAKRMGGDRLEVVGPKHALHILVVDDERPYTELLKEYFVNRGYGVTTAYSGGEALDLLNRRTFDIMFLDIRMPGITGIDVLQRIPEIRKSMRVIVLTAVDDHDMKKVMYEYGACEFLQKPISIEYLDKSLMARILEMRTGCVKNQKAGYIA